jgi:hypothetical protein
MSYFEILPLELNLIIFTYLRSDEINVILDDLDDILIKANLTPDKIYRNFILTEYLNKNPELLNKFGVPLDKVYDYLADFKLNFRLDITHQNLMMISGFSQEKLYNNFYKYDNCQYIYMRGNQVGSQCGKKAMFYKYCKMCMKKYMVKEDLITHGIDLDHLNSLLEFKTRK